MEAEFSLFLGRDKYQRDAVKVSSRVLRNGHYQRSFAVKGLGKLQVKVPRDRSGKFKTKKIVESVEAWRTSEITDKFKYLYLDGTNFSMRIDGSVEKVNVLVVIGVSEAGVKQVIALQAGGKESSSNWRELFRDMKARGLDSSQIRLGIMDGLPGLEKVFAEEFKGAMVQRCQVHVARDVMSKVPRKMKEKVADEMRSIFYVSTEKKAREFFATFKKNYEGEVPSAVKCLESSLDETLAYLKFPKEEWKSLRTTNPIERLNKEFKRRTKSMETVAGEKSCYNLLAIICLRMELYWRRYPITWKGALPEPKL
jgi:putative transposase